MSKLWLKWLTAKEVIKHLTENSDYKENIEEILTKYFEQNENMLREWSDWFNGKEMWM